MPIAFAEIETFDGLAAHPLFVHVPVILVPLAFAGAILALARPRWRSWALPLTAVFAGIGFIGVQLAVMSGEGLEELLGEEEAAIERHAEIAEQARPMVLLFLLVALAAAAIWWVLHREGTDEGAPRTATLRKLAVPVMALSVLSGALATYGTYRAGHTGAEAVWKGEGEKGGEDREGDHEHEDEEHEDEGGLAPGAGTGTDYGQREAHR